MPLSALQTAFSGNPLDRADRLRGDPEIFADHMKADSARVMLLLDGMVLSDSTGGILWLKPRQIRLMPVKDTIFLGLDEGEMRYAAALEGEAKELNSFFPEGRFLGARAVALQAGYPAPFLGIIAQAKSMLGWHDSHRFCAKCGSPSTLTKAGYERRCDACNTSHFPRTDPVVIMLARFGDEVLIGRGPHLSPDYFSALAGFMEPGETIEEAVARELDEEVGLTVERVSIVANQPWPWPSSLMIGCMADVTDQKLTLDKTEIDQARWIDRSLAVRALEGANDIGFLLPPPLAIAHTLVRHWVDSTR